jgi:hypothetical protein
MASTALGNALLSPLDKALEQVATHLRYVDDVRVFLRDGTSLDLAEECVDHALGKLGLQRSQEKTFRFESRLEAARKLELGFASGIGTLDESPGERSNNQRLVPLIELLDEEMPDARVFRRSLQVEIRTGGSSALLALTSRPDLMNLDPELAGDAIATLGKADVATDQVLDVLETLPQEAALHLHLFRGLERCDPDPSASSRILAYAQDEERHPVARAWAWRTAGSTPGWNASQAMEAAREERSWLVARGIVGAFRNAREDLPRLVSLLEAMASLNPEILPSVDLMKEAS